MRNTNKQMNQSVAMAGEWNQPAKLRLPLILLLLLLLLPATGTRASIFGPTFHSPSNST